jgi:hypothetical protein
MAFFLTNPTKGTSPEFARTQYVTASAVEKIPAVKFRTKIIIQNIGINPIRVHYLDSYQGLSDAVLDYSFELQPQGSAEHDYAGAIRFLSGSQGPTDVLVTEIGTQKFAEI